MKLGISLTLIIIYFLTINLSFSNDKITSTPLLNLNEIKPSFEELDDKNETVSTKKKFEGKEKK